MNVWARLYSVVDAGDPRGIALKVSSQIHIVIHGTEQAARDAVAEFGGLALEINSSSLKGAIDDDIYLLRTDNDGGFREEGTAETTADVSIARDSVRYDQTDGGVEFVNAICNELEVGLSV
jgi:hypothetical protein